MFSLCPNPNFYANPNFSSAISDCYIQACKILAGSCSEIATVSRVKVRIKVRVRDQYVKGLKWYGMDVSYPWLSNWSCLQGHCTASTHSG